MVGEEKKRIVFTKIYWILYRSGAILSDEKPAVDSLS